MNTVGTVGSKLSLNYHTCVIGQGVVDSSIIFFGKVLAIGLIFCVTTSKHS